MHHSTCESIRECTISQITCPAAVTATCFVNDPQHIRFVHGFFLRSHAFAQPARLARSSGLSTASILRFALATRPLGLASSHMTPCCHLHTSILRLGQQPLTLHPFLADIVFSFHCPPDDFAFSLSMSSGLTSAFRALAHFPLHFFQPFPLVLFAVGVHPLHTSPL